MDLQCISKASMAYHRCSLAAASIVLSLFSHSGYCRDDSRQYMTISACPAAAVSLGTLSQKKNQKRDAYSVYPGIFTRWMFGLCFSLTVHGLQISAPVRNHQIHLKYGDEQADAGRDCRTRLARPKFQVLKQTGKCSFSLFSLPLAGLTTLLG